MTDILVACRPKDCPPRVLEALHEMAKAEEVNVEFLYADDQDFEPNTNGDIKAFFAKGPNSELDKDEARRLAEGLRDIDSFNMGDFDGDRMLPSKHYEQKIPHLKRGGYLGRDRKGRH